MPLRIVFAGTPDFAARHLQTLIENHHEVVAVYTQPDRPAGRGKQLKASDVKQLALKHELPVYQPLNFKEAADQQALAELNADIMVVVAYGLLLPKVVLDTPRLGCINVHGSLLPLWRGAAPIQRSLQAGDPETGVTIMQMDIGLDTGDMLLKAACPIESTDTSASLYEKLALLGPQAMLDALQAISAGTATPVVQSSEQATYAAKLSKAEAQIDWSKTARDIDLTIRAFTPWPGSQTQLDGKIIKVHKAEPLAEACDQAPGTIVAASKQGIDVATGESLLRLTQIQLPGKKPVAAADALNARADWFAAGNQFSLPESDS